MSRSACFRITASVLFAALAGLLGACNQKTEPESVSATPGALSAVETVPADSSLSAVAIEAGERSFEITEKVESWPTEIPSGVPRFAAGTIRKIIRTETPEGRSWDMAVENLPSHAATAYVEVLKEAGFETTSMIVSGNEGERGTVTGLKDEIAVVLIASGGNASLSVILKQ